MEFNGQLIWIWAHNMNMNAFLLYGLSLMFSILNEWRILWRKEEDPDCGGRNKYEI
jgi:hypothetical protein